jgi:predicted small secreted protein
MKRSRILLTALLILLALFLAACSVNTPQPTEGLSKDTADDFSGFAVDSHERLLGMMPGGAGLSSLAASSGNRLPKQLDSLLPRSELNALSAGTEEDECITFRGDFTDTDSDEIPVDATFTFNCTYSEEGSDFTLKGSASFQDANDTDAFSGYTIKFTDVTTTETKNGKTNTLELDQTFVLKIDDTKRRYTTENDLELTAATPEESFTYAELATLGYTPDNVTDPFAAGTFAFNTLTTWRSGKDIYKLTGVSPALHYSASCESGFDGGTLSMKDNFENALVLIYNACNNVTVLYNGSPL